MARQIGKMLNAREPKVVNGPEILNKFVGQSEENIRKLFGDAEKEVRYFALSVIEEANSALNELLLVYSTRRRATSQVFTSLSSMSWTQFASNVDRQTTVPE